MSKLYIGETRARRIQIEPHVLDTINLTRALSAKAPSGERLKRWVAGLGMTYAYKPPPLDPIIRRFAERMIEWEYELYWADHLRRMRRVCREMSE